MNGRVIHVSSPSLLSQKHGALEIAVRDQKPVLLPIEDLSVVLLDGEGIVVSAQALALLAAFNVALLVSDEKHIPTGLMLPITGHSTHAEVLRGQVECSLPKKKRIWQQIVKAKVLAQAGLLENFQKKDRRLFELVEKVGSGDPTNIEARAAVRYWDALFGPDFTRERGAGGENALLNYGYAILRSLTARALCGAGLHPALGVFHGNRYNAYALADDAMEPLRPLVDFIALKMIEQDGVPDTLTPPLKKKLLSLTQMHIRFAGQNAHIQDGLERMATSLRRAICEEGRKVEIPEPSWSAATDLCGSW
jgi:CRISP-associated protein Cas1